MLKILKSIFILFALVCSGCVSVPPNLPLSEENRAQIKSIWVNQTDKPVKMYIYSQSGDRASFMLGGVLGMVIYNSGNEADATNMENYAQGNNVNISEIVNEQIKKQFKEKLPYKINDKSQNIKLNTKIVEYGLSIPHLFSSHYVPHIKLNCQLIKGDQIIMDVTIETKLQDQFLKDDLLKDPKNLWTMWDKTAEDAVAQLMENFYPHKNST